MFCLDLDYLMGSVHYGLYLGICLLGRAIAGLGWVPTNLQGTFSTTTTTTTSWLEPIGSQLDWLELAQVATQISSSLANLA